jgi:Protein of unknown function (DUF4232)
MTETAPLDTKPRPMARRAVRALPVLAVLFAVTACGPTAGTAQPPIPPATSDPAAVATTPAAGPATTPAQAAPPAQPAPPAGIARCTLDKLKVTTGTGDAGTGHRSIPLIFTNTSSAPCRLYGYPGVAALDGHGNQVAQARRTLSGYLGGTTTGPANVDISGGQSASALVELIAFNVDGTACTAYPALLVTPPDETHSVKVAIGTDGCSDPQIHPVVPGITGSKL